MSSAASRNPGCLSSLLRLLGIRPSAPVGPLPYRVRDDFLSQAEISLHRVLRSALSTHATICTKVRLADVFFVSRPDKNRVFFNRIIQKHVDFLVCDPRSMRPLVAIELDDATHRRSDRVARDEFVDAVFQAAALPLLHIRAQRDYSAEELGAQIAPFIRPIGAP